MRPPPSFFSKLYDFQQSGQISLGVNFSLDHIGPMVSAGDTRTVDYLLVELDVDRLGISILHGILVATSAIKDDLPSRSAFMVRVRDRVLALKPSIAFVR